jgi:predicted secreted protein
MRKLFLQTLLLTVFAVPALAQAQAVPAPLPGPGETIVNLSATEHGNVQQDLLTASLNVERQNANPRTVQNEVNTLMQKAAAKAKAVPGVEVSTGQYYVYPVDSEPVVQPDGTTKIAKKPRTWRANQTLELRSTQPDALLPLTGDLQDMGLNVQNLSYTLSPEKEEQAKDALLESALAKLKAKAERTAKALGKSHADLVEVNIDSSYNPPPMMPMMARAMTMSAKADMAAPTAEAGSNDITLTVSARAVLKP